jgi:hypothetical protein
MAQQGVITNLGPIRNRLKQQAKERRLSYTRMLREITHWITERILARTPVQTGHTLANYMWTRGFGVPGTVSFRGEATPGTNQMALGTEPNRSAAEAVVWAQFNRIPWKDMLGKQLTLVNNAEAFSGLEAGELPDGPRFTPRSPRGMVGITLAEARTLVASGHFSAPMRRGRR